MSVGRRDGRQPPSVQNMAVGLDGLGRAIPAGRDDRRQPPDGWGDTCTATCTVSRQGHVVLPADDKDLAGRHARGHDDLRRSPSISVGPYGKDLAGRNARGHVDLRMIIKATWRDSSFPAVAGWRPIPRDSGRDSDRDRGRLRRNSREARPDEKVIPLLPKPHGWPLDVRYCRLGEC